MEQAITASENFVDHFTAIETVFIVDGVLDGRALARHNKDVINAALKELGIQTVNANYNGNGDEGGNFEFEFTPSDNGVESAVVTVKVSTSVFDTDTKHWTNTVSDDECSLEQAIEAFTENLITLHGHEDYEDGDGGGGNVTFDVEQNTVEHDHYDNIVETVHNVNEL